MTEGPEYIPTPEERQRNREQSRGGSPDGGAPTKTNWWSRRSTGAKILIILVSGIIFVSALGAALGGGNSKQTVVTFTEAAQPTSTPKPAVKTPAQKRAEARASVRAQKIARAKALVAAGRAREAAAAHAAYVLAANRWHQGYTQQDANVFWQFRNGLSCKDYAQSGCWHVAVITRNGCPGYVAVNANEYQGGAIIGQLLDNQGYGIPAQTVRVFELDADTSNVQAGDVSIDCT